MHTPQYRIHPAIGIARLGDSPTDFYIAPDKPAEKPTDCDAKGNPLVASDGITPVAVTLFKDAAGRIKRQAARFSIFLYSDDFPDGKAIKIGDRIAGGGNNGTLVDIIWQVYPANKKSVWHEFRGLDGETGYQPDHVLRNANVEGDNARQQLIIDPGPQIVNGTDRRRAEFSRDGNPEYAVTFPPQGLWPHDIDTLGSALTDDLDRLLVLGGHGRSGTYKTGIGQPRIDNYANTDGWFDDTSDGPVMARLVMFSDEVQQKRYIDIEYPAWVVSGYPRYSPEMLDMITMDEVVEDLMIRQFAYRTDLFGTAGTFGQPQTVDIHDPGALNFWKNGRLEWNGKYKPFFWRDIWPILFRPNEFNWVSSILLQSNEPHDQSKRGTFDPYRLGEPPMVAPAGLRRRQEIAVLSHAGGDQAAEALEPALLRRERDGHIDGGGLNALMDNLRAAFTAFVDQVAAPAQAENAEAYLRRWQKIYDADPSPIYAEAKAMLAARLDALLFPKLRLMARRESDESATAPDPNESLRSAADRVQSEFLAGKLLGAAFQRGVRDSTTDPYGPMRRYLYNVLRRPGEENVFQLDGNPTTRTFHLPLMPLLAGDNPKYNEIVSKFLRLTDTQLFLLKQWSEGVFINEEVDGIVPAGSIDPWQPYSRAPVVTGRQLDRGVLTNVLGGAFFPGGEIGWIMRNAGVWHDYYRLKADPQFSNFRLTAAQENKNVTTPVSYVSYAQNPLSQGSNYAVGLQPGDLSKMMALPWQADFNECTTQTIDVTYQQWNSIDPANPENPAMRREQKVWETMWWPAHRPLQVVELIDGVETPGPLNWSRSVPQTHAGDLKMVMAWTQLSFVVMNPTATPAEINSAEPSKTRFVGVEGGKTMT